MEQIHGIDVSWMTHHGSPKGAHQWFHGSRDSHSVSPEAVLQRRRAALQKFELRLIDHIITDRATRITPSRRSTVSSGNPSGVPPSASPVSESAPANDAKGDTEAKPNTTGTQPKPIPLRPGFTRSNSSDKSTGSPGMSRKGSWFSNISQKFSAGGGQSPPAANNAPAQDAEISVPKVTPAKNAVLQHAVKYQGEGPYTPAPPKTGQTGIMHVFRRLSSSGSGQLGPSVKGANNHGLVERKVLNVDRNRERCPLSDLNAAKLRKVAFCVDVEIAPMPKYVDPDASSKKVCVTGDKSQKRKMVDKGEGAALKNPKAVEDQKEHDGVIQASGEELPKEPEMEGQDPAATNTKDPADCPSEKGGDTKKKEKKKRSEEERKARKEKKRKLAEANGQIPMELHLDSDSSSDPTPAQIPTPARTQAVPTTNPVRIYRRCCQLRETPILKKITEQLASASNHTHAGVVEKLDLTGYWMQLADLVTLGDYLAVVPIKEVILENCGLTDEGLRVILSGLLAAKKPSSKRKRASNEPDGLVSQGGTVERLVLKNNKFGVEGWKHIYLFIYMCRTLKNLDLSEIPFPKPTGPKAGNGHAHHFNNHNHKNEHLDTCQLLKRSIGERLGGSTLELLNIGETGLTTNQLGCLIDGVIQSGIRRLGLAHLHIDEHGLSHIERYLKSGKCEGLDLGGNELRDHCDFLSSILGEDNHVFALSLAECNLKPTSLCKLLPQLSRLPNLRFIDLSHNQDLFNSDPSAVGMLRRFVIPEESALCSQTNSSLRYLPKMPNLKRIHLSDCALKPDQTIALAEVIPEMPCIAHVNFLENPELTKLADAKTEEGQEEATALYASLLAAARMSTSIVCIDIDVPTDASGEIVRALAKQVVAYCLRNMEYFSIGNAGEKPQPEYPDVLQHLVGHDVMEPDAPSDDDVAPDEDYIVGGTGVAKALACCLNNRGDESRRQSGEFIRELETGVVIPRTGLPAGKAKVVSQHLLLSARKIRRRLHPALIKAKAQFTEDQHTYRKFHTDFGRRDTC